MRLIDADCLLKILEREQDHIKDIPIRVDGLIDAIMDVLSAPTVDAVEVVHGRWIEDPDDDWGCRCSECGHLELYQFDYCSSCGARMDGKGGDGNG